MARASRRHLERRSPGLLWRWGPVVLVLAILCGAAAAYHYGVGADPTPPAPAAPSIPGLTLRPVADPPEVARASPATSIRGIAVRRALAAPLADPHLDSLRAVVAPLTGAPVLDEGRGLSMPASTMKLLTTTAALDVLGPDHTFATRVVADGRHGHGFTLVGGGDPFLASKHVGAGVYPRRASLQDLATLTAKRLQQRGVHRVRLTYDTSLFTGPRVNPHWPATYLSEAVVSPITALWADEGVPAGGRGRVADPAAAAAAYFAAYLRSAKIQVLGTPRAGKARAGATEVARVTSAPLGQLVERILQTSDNEGAEVLAHEVGLDVLGRGSFAGGAEGVTRTLTALGIHLHRAQVYDGSGLSRDDRIDADTLVEVLQYDASADHPDQRAVVTGLPVAAFNGSLSSRLVHTTGAGWVRAKTGTLSGTSALAGLASDARGHPLVFAFVANHVPAIGTLDAQAALDTLAAALARCRC